MNISEKRQIKAHLLDYLKVIDATFQFNTKNNLITCPICKHTEPTANIYQDDLTKVHCFRPECKFSGDIFELVRRTMKPFEKATDDKIGTFLKAKLKLQIKDETSSLLKRYEDASFALIAIAPNDKNPIENGWQKSLHKNSKIWKDWLDRNYNIGLKTGKDSNILVLDADIVESKLKKKIYSGNYSKEELEEAKNQKVEGLKILDELFKDVVTLEQDTFGGVHLIFDYDADIDKTNFDYKGIHFDIQSDGGQIIVDPSIVGKFPRRMNGNKIIPLPDHIKKWVLDNSKATPSKSKQETLQSEITNESRPSDKLSGWDGCYNNNMIRLGGILRKKMPKDTVQYALSVFNNQFDDPMPKKDMYALFSQIDKYDCYDKEELAKTLLNRLDIIKEGTAFQIACTLKLDQKDVEEVLKHLEDEQKVVRLSNGRYTRLNAVEWEQSFDNIGVPINFEVPYFHDYGYFDKGNMIVIGASTGTGKTHITGNIIKKLVGQNMHPYLISTEAGSKIGKIAQHLGMKVGDFSYKIVKSPTEIELEDNAVTIIDWLKPEGGDYARTDSTFEKLNDQLVKHGGFLIVFVQLRKSGDFFAPDQIDFYSALTAKYCYNKGDGKQDNVNTYFETTKIRDSKDGRQYIKIPTYFDLETKVLDLQK